MKANTNTSATPLKNAASITSQPTQILAQPNNGSNVYSILQPQQIQLEGQDFQGLFQNGQPIQIQTAAGPQLISPSQIVRPAVSGAQGQQQQVYIQNIGGMINGQQLAMRQGNVVQAIQLPTMQPSIPVQAMQNQNGQTILQTIQIPIQALNGLQQQQLAGQVMPQLQPVSLCYPF